MDLFMSLIDLDFELQVLKAIIWETGFKAILNGSNLVVGELQYLGWAFY